jgi:hypothetical protein
MGLRHGADLDLNLPTVNDHAELLALSAGSSVVKDRGAAAQASIRSNVASPR